ncbi:DsbA family protein [uncultured Chitinophaga sp.]|uniref:DsbA family protein n=1 Tax=uncultured Chitinophaga sp. TaxID=339340 RepID=UPI0025EDE9A1|nr:DsbA family protein [uncultured Chitinophaga sp.]
MKEKRLRKEKVQLNIIYFTDPLCCWSWLFEPAWRRLRNMLHPVLTYQHCMGGMLPSWDVDNGTANAVKTAVKMGQLWRSAKRESGTYINDQLWSENPPASSYPACIAVKSAGMQSLLAEELYLYKLRRMALVKGRNIAEKQVLLEAAHELEDERPEAFNYDTFLKHLTSQEVLNLFKNDLKQVRALGISRFPSLLISVKGKEQAVILSENCTYDTVMAAIDSLIKKVEA